MGLVVGVVGCVHLGLRKTFLCIPVPVFKLVLAVVSQGTQCPQGSVKEAVEFPGFEPWLDEKCLP